MADAMKDLPILFSGPMVKAILDGRKTMTRRLAMMSVCGGHKHFVPAVDDRAWVEKVMDRTRFQVGRRMWVRETWYDDNGLRHTEPTPTQPDRHIFYRADGEPQWEADGPTPWRPSIHMPRWASRITLRITAHRIERLHEITEDDARAEGCAGGRFGEGDDDCKCFACLWDRINGKRAPWASNPWVEVVSFERVPQ